MTKSFEERLGRVEEISEKLKDGRLPLEEAMALFEEGIKLSRGLEKELAKVERRVQILLDEPEKGEREDKASGPALELFPEPEDLDPDGPA